MTAYFDRAFELVVGVEGGYGNDPRDPGGETKYGVADARDGRKDGMADLNADGVPDLKIADLTLAQAKDVYRSHYWLAARCHNLSWPLSLLVFDAAVNQGVAPAVRLLQKLARVPQDGVPGPRTYEALARLDVGDAVPRYLALRALRYTGTRNFDRFGEGWLWRLFHLAMRLEP